ncbi:MAG: CARDB domain-containing protein, partial [bacterium]
MRKGLGTALLALVLTAVAPFPALFPEIMAAGRLDVVRVELAEKTIPPGGLQIVQITLGNVGRDAILAGLKVDLLNERRQRIGSPQTRKVIIPAKDEIRVLFRLRMPKEPGKYTVRFEVFKPDFKNRLIRGKPVFMTPFVVGLSADQRLQDQAQQTGLTISRFTPPTGLRFELPDLLLENVSIKPDDLLVGEEIKITADLLNVGGDIARTISVHVNYYNIRTPRRIRTISKHVIHVLAPGETKELVYKELLPKTSIVGSYQISLVVDVGDRVEELNEDNNTAKTAQFQLNRIKLIFPQPDFSFEEAGLFLFRWNTLSFDELKVQVGIDKSFRETENFFDLPQG